MEYESSTFIYCLGTTNSGDKNSPLNAMELYPVLTPRVYSKYIFFLDSK